MEYTPELAEVCGIHAGDGYLRNKNYNRELDISGSFEEQVYYDEHVIPLFSKVFGISITGRVFPSRGTYGFIIRNKEVIQKMHDVGFPYGKKTLIVRVPKFVMESTNPSIKCAFLRGLLDTDGCIAFERKGSKNYSYFKRTHNYYPVISIATVAREFMEDLQILLRDNGIMVRIRTYAPKEKNAKLVYNFGIYGPEFQRWMEIIGSKNHVKMSRYLIWKKYGHCPTHTSYAKRLSILRGDIILEQGPVAQLG